MTYKEYFENLRGKKACVVGAGVSNTPLIKMLVKNGVNVTVCDKKEELGKLGEELKNIGALLNLGKGYLDNIDADIIFRSPGIRPDIPQFVKAVEKGAYLTSEMEAFFELCPCKIIAVTGSDGKTTTTTLISKILEKEGYKVHVGGNIGKPLLPEIEDIKDSDIAVLELSSFQLFTIKKSPDIAVITNLEPNHLDWHKDYGEYIEAKKNIMLYQGKDDILVTNAYNKDSVEIKKQAKGISRTFSINCDALCHLEDDFIMYGNEKVLNIKDIVIPGMHNVENYMTAIAAVYDLVKKETITTVARTFGGVKHRIEFVREINGVKFYNDSIASSPSRAIAGLKSFDKKIIMIAGGYDKKIPYDILGPVILERVKKLVVLGATGPKIKEAVIKCKEYKEETVEIKEATNLEDAINKARENAKEGDVIILCPASASFDMFENFEQRGNLFKELVNKL